MATHSSVLAWRIPGMGEPGGLPSMGSHRVGHDGSDLAAAAAFFIVQLSHPYMTTGKTIASTIWTFVNKVMSLLFKMLPRFVIAFLPSVLYFHGHSHCAHQDIRVGREMAPLSSQPRTQGLS